MTDRPSISRQLTKTVTIVQLAALLMLPAAFIQRFWWKITLFALGGALLGYALGFLLLKPKYRAVYIIAAEEEQSQGIERLAAQFGFDMGLSNPGGVFRGESLVHLFLTRSMLERALLAPVVFEQDTTTTATLFFKASPHSKKSIFKNLQFVPNQRGIDPLADSALFLTQKYVREKVLSVDKPDKKMGFIYVRCTHNNGKLAALFSQVLINTVKDFYIESVTAKARKNVDVLRNEADSVQKVLIHNLLSNASALDMNVNAVWQSMRIGQNRAAINVQISAALYAELMKNLKMAEIALRRQTPLIQVIEQPVFPLERAGLKPWQLSVVFGLLSFALSALLAWLLYRQMVEQSDAS